LLDGLTLHQPDWRINPDNKVRTDRPMLDDPRRLTISWITINGRVHDGISDELDELDGVFRDHRLKSRRDLFPA